MTAENARVTRDKKKWHTRRIPRLPTDFLRSIDEIDLENKHYAFFKDERTLGSFSNSKKMVVTHWSYDHATSFLVPSHYELGDLCWIAEPYQVEMGTCKSGKAGTEELLTCYGDRGESVWVPVTRNEWDKWFARKYPCRYSPGRFMYKSLARTIVEIKQVWAEQVQDISDDDAYAEGITEEDAERHWYDGPQPVSAFAELWDSINKSRGFGWDVNPWVYAYEYELVKKLR